MIASGEHGAGHPAKPEGCTSKDEAAIELPMFRRVADRVSWPVEPHCGRPEGDCCLPLHEAVTPQATVAEVVMKAPDLPPEPLGPISMSETSGNEGQRSPDRVADLASEAVYELLAERPWLSQRQILIALTGRCLTLRVKKALQTGLEEGWLIRRNGSRSAHSYAAVPR